MYIGVAQLFVVDEGLCAICLVGGWFLDWKLLYSECKVTEKE